MVEGRRRAGAEPGAADGLVAGRFPELAVEHFYELRGTGDVNGRQLWVCRAPSEAHVRAWAGASGVAVDAVSLIDGEGEPSARPSDR